MQKFLLLAASVAFSAIPLSSFSEEFHDPAAEYVINQQIMFTAMDGQFNPTGSVTRLEFVLATIDSLYPFENTEGCFQSIAPSQPPRFTRLFEDVIHDDWYAPRLCVAMRAGLIQGDGEGNFRPFSFITAAEASKVMARAYGMVPAAQATETWYEAPMSVLRMRGAIGSDASPLEKLKRRDMAKMFYTLRNDTLYPMIGSEQPAQTPETDTATPTTPATDTPTAPTAQQRGECPVVHINSPGTALLALGIEAHPRTAQRRSRRVLEADAVAAYENGTFTGPDNGIPVTSYLSGCANRSLQSVSVPRVVTESKPSNRALREQAQRRGEESGRPVDRNVGY